MKKAHLESECLSALQEKLRQSIDSGLIQSVLSGAGGTLTAVYASAAFLIRFHRRLPGANARAAGPIMPLLESCLDASQVFSPSCPAHTQELNLSFNIPLLPPILPHQLPQL